jgi:hypothetical protein
MAHLNPGKKLGARIDKDEKHLATALPRSREIAG